MLIVNAHKAIGLGFGDLVAKPHDPYMALGKVIRIDMKYHIGHHVSTYVVTWKPLEGGENRKSTFMINEDGEGKAKRPLVRHVPAA